MPTAGPLTLAITGFGTVAHAREQRVVGVAQLPEHVGLAVAPSSAPPLRSAPEENAGPAPVKTITRTSGSASARSSAASMSSPSLRVHAFSASGRLSTTVATPASVWSFTVCSSSVVIARLLGQGHAGGSGA